MSFYKTLSIVTFFLYFLSECGTVSLIKTPPDTSSNSGENILRFVRLNEFCSIDDSLQVLECIDLKYLEDLPEEHHLKSVDTIRLRNITPPGVSQDPPDVKLQALKNRFPGLLSFSLSQSPTYYPYMFDPELDRAFSWPAVRELGLSGNHLGSQGLPGRLLNIFPKLESLDISDNRLVTLQGIPFEDWKKIKQVDLSGNPLDCMEMDLKWIEDLKLLRSEKTVCDRPAHQNKAKPMLETIALIKEVRGECRLNCSCVIDYIWEQEKVLRSKVAVNCTSRNFTDFPDPSLLPKHTDVLYLQDNQITGLEKFVEDTRYLQLNIKDLYLDNNQISSINILESSQWFYQFQVLSLRNNKLTEVPVYLLETTMRQNKRIYFIDLSKNSWYCDCRTVTTFKVWLLKYSSNVKHIDEVQCAETKEQIRYLKDSEWCRAENGEQLIDVLDCISIIFAILILIIICKVYYDYHMFKKTGKLPFFARHWRWHHFHK